ncbi:MAG TPA: shikimate dehydrogenase [bacterium]|nr:shikimate dehydrogenase [bacterium]
MSGAPSRRAVAGGPSAAPGRFAFVIHPLYVRQYAQKFPITRFLPGRLVERAFRAVPPFEASHITGIVSATGARAEGWFIALPWTPRVLLDAPVPLVYRRLVQAGRIAERLGAGILGLGAFTKIVGDRGLTVARELAIGVTTGNSLTAATAVEGALAAAERMEIDPRRARVAVLGATGSIGAVCCRLLAPQVAGLVLAARHRGRLDALAARLRTEASADVEVTADVRDAVSSAEIVLTVTSATDVLVEPEDLRPGAVVCDVARPRNVSQLVYERRRDVLVIDGGVIDVPGPVDFGLDFGFPPGSCEACMAETMLLALEHRYEDYTLGAEVEVERVREIHALMHRHGFRLSGLRRFERRIGDDEVDAIRRAARGAVGAVRARPVDAPAG